MCVTRYAIARPPVCPSPVLADTRFDHSKTVEVRIMKFSPYLAPSLWLLRGEFHPEILTGSPPRQTGDCGENKLFSSCKRKYVENGRRYVRSYC